MATTVEDGHLMSGGDRGKTRAADADRDHVAGLLATAYSEGRLSKDEYDARLEAAFSARTYADLDLVVNDVPARASPAGPGARTNTGEQGAGLALAGLVLGWGAVILAVALIAVGLAVAAAAGMHGTMQGMHGTMQGLHGTMRGMPGTMRMPG